MWRKVALIASFIILSFSASAQESNFGFTAGYLNTHLKLDSESNDTSENAFGFYIGGFTDISLAESFRISIGANYGNTENNWFLFIPIMAKYYIAESNLYVQAGPQASFLFQKGSNASFETLGADIGFGAGFEINKNFYVEGKYFLGLTNRLDGLSENRDLKLNTLMIGLGYKI